MVFEHLGLPFKRTESIGYSLEPAPPYYSNIVSASPLWRPDDVFERVARRAAADGWPGWSIKDSHQVLDLGDRGLGRLFEARWLWRDAPAADVAGQDARLRFEVLDRVDDLRTWRRAWDPDERVGEAVFRATLIDDPRVCFISGHDGRAVVAGCLLNRTADIWGVSNTFGPVEDTAHWSELLGFVDAWTGGTPLVGYDRDEALPPMAAVGFETVGALTVWAT